MTKGLRALSATTSALFKINDDQYVEVTPHAERWGRTSEPGCRFRTHSWRSGCHSKDLLLLVQDAGRSGRDAVALSRHEQAAIGVTVIHRVVLLAFSVGLGATVVGGLRAQNPGSDQRPSYQHNSNDSPLRQITPQNVSRLTHAWTFTYGLAFSDRRRPATGAALATPGRLP